MKNYYIVHRGDTLSSISNKVFGNTLYAKQIADWNRKFNADFNPDRIFPEQLVLLPESVDYKTSSQATWDNKKTHEVKYGDTLWSLSKTYLGNSKRWTEIQYLNRLNSHSQILIGQKLLLPSDANLEAYFPPAAPVEIPMTAPKQAQSKATAIPVWSHIFVFADEIIPSSKAVRRVNRALLIQELQGNPQLLEQLLYPERHGFAPKNPTSKVSLARHILFDTDSCFISASKSYRGTQRPFTDMITGKTRPNTPYWIDLNKVRQKGGEVLEQSQILEALDEVAYEAQKRLDAGKKIQRCQHPSYIEKLRSYTQYDKEIVINPSKMAGGRIPAAAIKGPLSQGLTTSTHVVGVVGVALSVYDLTLATYESAQSESIIPIATEATVQIGGWAGAWAGAKMGSLIGGLCAAPTGPGAIISSVGCSCVGAYAGYQGSSWLANYLIDKPETVSE